MEFDETKDIKLKDKPLLTVIEAAKYFGIGKNKMNDLSNKKGGAGFMGGWQKAH